MSKNSDGAVPPLGLKPYSALEYIKTDAQLEEYVQARIQAAAGVGVPQEGRPQELVVAVQYVLKAFIASEDAGYRSRDRQFAIDILSKALEAPSGPPQKVWDAACVLATQYDALPHAAQRAAVQRLFQMIRDTLMDGPAVGQESQQ